MGCGIGRVTHMKSKGVDDEDVLRLREDLVRKLGLVEVKLLPFAAARFEHVVELREGQSFVAACEWLLQSKW